jgi:hypothetical protein
VPICRNLPSWGDGLEAPHIHQASRRRGDFYRLARDAGHTLIGSLTFALFNRPLPDHRETPRELDPLRWRDWAREARAKANQMNARQKRRMLGLAAFYERLAEQLEASEQNAKNSE